MYSNIKNDVKRIVHLEGQRTIFQSKQYEITD